MPSIENLAAIVLAHRDSIQLENLVAALPDCDVFVHWDAKSPALTPAERQGALAESRVRFLPRRDVRLASWSLVALELDAMRVVLERSRADYIAVMSGADYPLVNPNEINEALSLRHGRSWVRNVALPHELWNAPFARDGGLWRWRWYFPTRKDHVFMVKSKPVFAPVRRRVPEILALRASPHWKIVSRRDAQTLLGELDRRPDLVARGRHIFTPEESFISSVMASPELFGEGALQVDEQGPWYVSWSRGGGQQHPSWFGTDDLNRINTRRALADEPDMHRVTRHIFGRKFASTRDGALLSKVRSELWSPTAR